MQVGHTTEPPQPSEMVWLQVAGVQTAGTQHVPLPRQTWLPGHVPQSRVAPHWFDALPQRRPRSVQVTGWQQRFVLHTSPGWQPGHCATPPQPSSICPQPVVHGCGVQQLLLTQTPISHGPQST
jgi:hypothetical protein